MTSVNERYLMKTHMLDFDHPEIQALIQDRGWKRLVPYEAIGAVYAFVRDEILFGYNRDDSIPASEVLKDGYGQCNTKGTLLMALLRAVGIPARIHGFTIFNELQRGAIPGVLMPLAPSRILHSWVEIQWDGQWVNLEGYIIDREYLTKVQQTFAGQCEQFSGFGIATPCLSQPQVDWSGQDTYIQKEGIADDYGVFAQPDDFYRKHGINLSGAKRLLFRYLLRHWLNWNVDRIRRKGIPDSYIRTRESPR
ncbi:transglutaminase-like domain-containing protein [Hahella ganghwensis]|uniref:transglutaminase-like domain-containing protein n=1 Tax=Hahella ganghwensis TaxID=286420 RepID=UPI0004769CEC|nr:transglutaminase-like domain-containing protein [Hahella ganghwensis]